MPPKERKIEFNPLLIGGFLLAAAVVVLLVITLMQIFHKNPYGPETKIDNINVINKIVDKKLPQEQKDAIFAQLYNVLKYTLGDTEEPPASGALIREDTIDYGYDKNDNVYSGSFIVDVAAVEQSYEVQLSWSPDRNNTLLGGYPILITCAPKNLRIYDSQRGCVDSPMRELAWANAYQIDYTFGATTSQRIRGALNDVLIGNNESLDDLLATVDEVSLNRLRNQPDITYQYDVKLSGQTYTITTRVDETYGRNYIIIYVDGENRDQGVILTNTEDRIDEFSAWLRELSGQADLEITTGKINQED